MASERSIRAGKADVELSLNDKLDRGLKRAQAKLRRLGTSIQNIGRSFLAAGGVIVGSLGLAVRQFAAAGDELDKMSRRTGVSVRALSELKFAAEQSGSSLDSFEKGVRRMQRSIFDLERGSSTAVDAFAAIGLTLDDLRGLSPEAQFEMIAGRLAQVEDMSRRAAIAQQLFGRAGTELLPLLEQGAAGIDKLRQQARDLGITLDDEDAAAAAKLSDQLNILKRQLGAAAVQIGSVLQPAVSEVATTIANKGKAVIDLVKRNGDLIRTVGKVGVTLVAAGAALTALGLTIKVVAAGIGGLSVAVKALTAALTFLAAHPAVITVAALAAGVTALAGAYLHATNRVEGFSRAAADATKRGDQLRKTDQLRFQRLKQLDRQQSLTNGQMAEARDLIAALTGRYGDLGLSIDQTTGKIEGLASAQQKANALMRQAAIKEVEADLAETRRNAAALRKKSNIQQDQSAFEEGLRTVASVTTLVDSPEEKARRFHERFKIEEQRVAALQLRLEALRGGDEAAVTGESQDQSLAERVAAGEATVAEDAAAVKKAADEAARAEQRLADIAEDRARDRRSAIENEIHDIRALGEEQKRLYDQLIAHERSRPEPDTDRLAALEGARLGIDAQTADDIARVREREADRVRQDREEERRRELQAAQEQAEREAEARLDAEQHIQDEIERLRVQTDPAFKDDDLGRDLALLDLERQQALRDAAELGLDEDLINRKFNFRATLLKQQDVGVDTGSAAGTSSRGIFNAAALQSLQGGSFQTELLDANKRIARNTDRIPEPDELGNAY